MSNFIDEYEPLNWLVSSLFTDEFHDYRSMQYGSLLLYGSDSEYKYKDKNDLCAAIEGFIIKHEDASQCLEKAKSAIKNKDISEPEARFDEWGEPIGFDQSGTANTYEFYLWAESQSYAIPSSLMPLIEPLIQRAVIRKQTQDKIIHQYPPISREQFNMKAKEPLWQLGNAILYLLGHRNRFDGNKYVSVIGSHSVHNYINASSVGKSILKYAADAYKAGKLDLIASDEGEADLSDENLLLVSVAPEKMIDWVQTLPIAVPIFSEDTTVHDNAYITQDMKLMLDAAKALWSDYDLENPNPSLAPFKKDVVKWLMDEAKKRNMHDFSKSRAEVMDTIMRCPKSRGGGNTL